MGVEIDTERFSNFPRPYVRKDTGKLAVQAPSNEVKVPLGVALDGVAFQIQDAPEAFHTLQAFIGLMKEEADDVQRVVVEALLVASGAVNG